MKVGDIELVESNIFPEWDDVVKFVVSKAPLLLGAVIIVVVGFVLSNLVGKLVVKGMSYQVKIVPISPKYFRSLGIIVSEKRMHDKNIRRLISCSQSIITAKYGSQTL